MIGLRRVDALKADAHVANRQRVAVMDGAGHAAEAVPDGLALAVLEGGALDLGGRRCDAKDEGGRKRAGIREHEEVFRERSVGVATPRGPPARRFAGAVGGAE